MELKKNYANFDPVTSQFYTTIHTINSLKDADVFLYYENKEDKVDDWKTDVTNWRNFLKFFNIIYEYY